MQKKPKTNLCVEVWRMKQLVDEREEKSGMNRLVWDDKKSVVIQIIFNCGEQKSITTMNIASKFEVDWLQHQNTMSGSTHLSPERSSEAIIWTDSPKLNKWRLVKDQGIFFSSSPFQLESVSMILRFLFLVETSLMLYLIYIHLCMLRCFSEWLLSYYSLPASLSQSITELLLTQFFFVFLIILRLLCMKLPEDQQCSPILLILPTYMPRLKRSDFFLFFFLHCAGAGIQHV